MSPNYYYISRIYGVLQQLVFGNILKTSSSSGIKYLVKAEKLLIIGGGRGEILQDLDSHSFSGEIVFLDLSPSMIKQAKRKAGNLNVTFICQDIFEFNNAEFDAVHMGFFIDQFPQKRASEALKLKYTTW